MTRESEAEKIYAFCRWLVIISGLKFFQSKLNNGKCRWGKKDKVNICLETYLDNCVKVEKIYLQKTFKLKSSWFFKNLLLKYWESGQLGNFHFCTTFGKKEFNNFLIFWVLSPLLLKFTIEQNPEDIISSYYDTSMLQTFHFYFQRVFRTNLTMQMSEKSWWAREWLTIITVQAFS